MITAHSLTELQLITVCEGIHILSSELTLMVHTWMVLWSTFGNRQHTVIAQAYTTLYVVVSSN